MNLSRMKGNRSVIPRRHPSKTPDAPELFHPRASTPEPHGLRKNLPEAHARPRTRLSIAAGSVASQLGKNPPVELSFPVNGEACAGRTSCYASPPRQVPGRETPADAGSAFSRKDLLTRASRSLYSPAFL